MLLLILWSCEQRIELTENEKLWNPYKEGDVLVFESSNTETDTIFVLKVEDNIFPDGPGTMKYYNERLWVFVKHTDPNNDRYLYNTFFEIESKTPETDTKLGFGLTAKGSWFYNSNRTVGELSELSIGKLEIGNEIISDVITIEDTKRNHESRSNFVERTYWSKSAGYVGFDKKDSTKWRLLNKYHIKPAMKLIVISEYGQNEKIISEKTTIEEIEKTMSLINWKEFHQVQLLQTNGNWIEVGGNITDDGLSCIYEEYGLSFVTTQAPNSVKELTEILISYFKKDNQYKRNHQFE